MPLGRTVGFSYQKEKTESAAENKPFRMKRNKGEKVV